MKFSMKFSAARLMAVASLVSTASAASASASRMLVNVSEEYAIFDAAGTTVVQGKPFFAFADSLNPPVFANLYDGAGALVWSFTNATSGSYLLDTARHCEPSASPDGAVDVFVAVASGSVGGLLVFGLSSASKTATPAWTVSLPGCSIDGGGGTYQGIEASDSGNRVAVQCPHSAATPTARVYSIAGQTGKVEWMYDLGPSVKLGQGQVQISTDGAWVLFVNEQGTPTPNTAEAFIIDGATGKLRDSVIIPFFITAAISDSRRRRPGRARVEVGRGRSQVCAGVRPEPAAAGGRHDPVGRSDVHGLRRDRDGHHRLHQRRRQDRAGVRLCAAQRNAAHELG
jgi:hypothetical protein